MIKKYKKRPVIIDAIQYDGGNLKEIIEFVGEDNLEVVDDDINLLLNLYIKTLEGNMLISNGDFVIKGVNGEFYPCKADIFEKTYEEVEEDNSTSKKYKAGTITRTCIACPSQWDIYTTDGTYIYGRFRWGRLSLSLDVLGEEIFSGYSGNGLSGDMSDEEMMEMTKDVIDWSSVKKG